MERRAPVQERHITVPRSGRRPDLDRRLIETGDESIQTVIVPVDGSPLAERAIGVAADLATAVGADLRLFKASFKLDVRDEVDQLRDLADYHGLHRAQVEVSTGRSAAPAVILASRRAPGSMVVMATHGRSGLGATLLGSVAGEVLSDLDAPMVLVGPGFEGRGVPSRIIVCWDGTLPSAAVVPSAAALAARLDLPALLLHVCGVAEPPLLAGSGSSSSEAARQIVAALTVHGRPPEMVEIVDGDPADEVLGFVRSVANGALLALATKGRMGLLSSPLGRVASRIVRESPHPILVTHFRP